MFCAGIRRTSRECAKCRGFLAKSKFSAKANVSPPLLSFFLAKTFVALPSSAKIGNVTGITDDSTTLVPGDVIDLSEASLTTFPADLVLLSGDAIVNESMLTGESVPVSKVPVEADVVEHVSIPGGDIATELARHVVFNGTKIIRVRQTTPSVAATATTTTTAGGPGSQHEPEALGMVLRTGFNTTKGALVRSMLFPKPFG